MIKNLLRGRKVLIVLDDVNDRKQLEVLAGEPDWFKWGSRVIITTRDKQVLSARGMKVIEVNLLSRAEAMCLLSKNAFKRDIPIEGYEDLSGQVVKYADGLPLTIEVLGSMLYDQNKPQWIDTLERLRTIPLKETLEKLELSYKSIDDDYKQIFLDVACLLKGWQKDDAIRALESCGFHARNGLRVLEQRSLINISEDGKLWMHDHLEEMGMDIVRRVNHNKPETHSRLWIRVEIVDILTNNSGTQATKCIRLLNPSRFNFEILMKGLANMKELRFLRVNGPYEDEVSNWSFEEVDLYLPNALRFLKWSGYSFLSLPKTFQAKNLAGLEMFESRMVQLWKGGEEKPCLKLRFLKFAYSWLRTLDLSVAPNLETLILEHCGNLVEVHFQVTQNLKELRVYYCDALEKLRMPAESPKLRSLDLNRCSELRILHLGITPNLERLRVKKCTGMVELHMLAECPKLVNIDLDNLQLMTLHLRITPNLETLRLVDCTNMVELHMPAECPKLVDLDLSNLKLMTLRLGINPNLETLILNNCTDMVELHMPAECPKLVNLDLSKLKLRTLHLGITPNLETLRLVDCTNMVELHLGINAPAECLKKLLYLDISHCGRFKSFEFDKERDSPDVVSLSELHLIADDTGICDPGNTWPEFEFSCYYKEDPASSFGNLGKLISLGFGDHINVDSFSDIICGLQCLRKLTLEGGIPEVPKNLDRLDCLEELIFSSTEIRNLPDSICNLKHLKSLELKSCLLLKKLPDDLGRIESLETLIITNCNRLRDIPNNMGKIKCVISPKVYKRYTHGKFKQQPIDDAVDRPTGANT